MFLCIEGKSAPCLGRLIKLDLQTFSNNRATCQALRYKSRQNFMSMGRLLKLASRKLRECPPPWRLWVAAEP
jgi:hypothetical protein